MNRVRGDAIKYEDYFKLIAKAAWTWAGKGNQDYDFWLSEGNMVFVKAARSYKPGKAAFSTYLFVAINNRYKSKLNEIYRKYAEPLEEAGELPQSNFDLSQFVMDLGKEARELVELIFNGPAELMEMAKDTSRGVTLTVLRKYVNKATGMEYKNINRAIKEIKENLQEV